MTVIKSSRATAAQAAVLDLNDLAREARSIVETARKEAAQVLADARRRGAEEAAAARAKADAEGRAAGFETGRAEGRDAGRTELIDELRPRLEALLEGWTKGLDGWAQRRETMLREARQDVLELALAVARRVVHRVPEHDPVVVVDQVGAALALVAAPSEAEVSIHPEDRPVVEAHLPEILRRVESAGDVRLRDDPSLSRGGCRVRSAGGAIDASIETQLERIADALVPREVAP